VDTVSDSSLSAKRVAGRYRLIHRVGGGNMSTVYEAEDTRRGNRTVAVKLLNTEHDDALKQEIFRRETRALAQLEHPNIVSVLDYGWSGEYRCHYLVFEYIPRTLLDEITAHPNNRDHDWCWPLMCQMTDALVHAHSQGVIHRDVKPSNVLIAAAGRPMLVDFGVSLLKFELATGVTVSSFFSIGYASPEQRRGEQATEQSDIYSLGCVFYHMLARKAPPSEGFLKEAHIEALPVFGQIKQILLRMLAEGPGERFSEAVQLRRRLDVTHNLELLPDVHLLVTDRARRDLFDGGFIEETSTRAACAFLLKELGDDNPKAVHMSLDRGDMRIYTETLRFICARDPALPVLVIKAVHEPYPPQLEQAKSRADSFRFLWQVIDSMEVNRLPAALHPTLSATLDSLFSQLATHLVEEQTGRQRGFERKDLTRTWEAVLSFQQERLDAVPKLPYHYVTKAGDTLLFQLKQPAPDLPWPENAPVAVIDPDKKGGAVYVGHIMAINGKTVHVIRDAGDTHTAVQPAEQMPSPGLLGLYQQEAKVALERQQAALNIIRDGITFNPRLPEVLLDLSTAEFDEPDESLEFFQDDLALDKQQAVRQALAARDIFLLQGPPGTGKTTTLAEIILQILKIKPDARILVASQSNVAVNHILSRIAELQGTHRIEIVRIGRAEKIGHGAEMWTIEQRLSRWREEVLVRTDGVMGDLKERLRKRHREQKDQRQYAPSVLEDLQQCQTWLEDLAGEFAELATLDGLELEEKTNGLAETLALIRDTLPEEAQGEALPSLAAEAQRLSLIVADLLSPGPADSREQALLRLVTNWRKIFGKQEEFARPILERASILAATCLISGGYYLREQQFDWTIIDEAGRATAPELLVPLVRSRRAIIVGDERQLPPMLEDLPNADLARLGTTKGQLTESLFATLVAQGKDENLPAVQMLTMQHRMHPAIGQLVSSVFYGGKLTHAVEVADREHQLPWLARPVAWFSTATLPKHGETSQGPSFYNRAEIRAISYLLHHMERTYEELGQRREVAVITPYNAQIVELVAELTPDNPYWRALSIEVSTIDAFQGRDRDIVLYSTVRSNTAGRLGFLRDRRRLNVALSRAREALLIIGDIGTLERGWAGQDGNPYQELIRYLHTHPEDCLIDNLDLEVQHG
jgi:serine/threonine protein kinase/DNA polymerase III delta prime subunit